MTDLETIKALWLRLEAMPADGPDADAVRDEGDAPWGRLTEGERDEFRRWVPTQTITVEETADSSTAPTG